MNYTINERGDLVIKVTPEEQAEIRETVAESGRDSCTHEAEVLEPLVCNSELDWVPDGVVALCSAPMLGTFDEPTPEDDRPLREVWAYMDYQVKSFVDDLIVSGQCIFQSGNPIESNK